MPEYLSDTCSAFGTRSSVVRCPFAVLVVYHSSSHLQESKMKIAIMNCDTYDVIPPCAEGYVHDVMPPVDDSQCTSAEASAPSNTGSSSTIDDGAAVTIVTSTRSPATPVTPNSSSPAALTNSSASAASELQLSFVSIAPPPDTCCERERLLLLLLLLLNLACGAVRNRC
eukprot:COSAG06_NODE_4_length_41837_cov_204.557597_31_plen_170_part_00